MSIPVAQHFAPLVLIQRRLPWGLIGLLALAFIVVPLWGNDYWLNAILIPFLVLSLAGLGLNLLTGYTGQTSVGAAGFMAVGAFATYGFLLRLPGWACRWRCSVGGLSVRWSVCCSACPARGSRAST